MTYNFKGEMFQALLDQAKKDTEKGELMELEDMAKNLGYTPRDVAKAIADRFADGKTTHTRDGRLFRFGVLMGWYAALAKAPVAKPWWKRLGGM